ncbi:response regulator [Salinimicrobium sp. HB62]|uniref:response regulator n=1 Tax=Salinimicrobium sp. HB62 TaxID=3077781 RepID=UPI002D773D35|nr:response regulator [Salinimicrobium sp. HB62]
MKKRQYLLVDDDLTSNLISELLIRKVDPEAKILSYNIPEEALADVENICVPEETACILFLDVNMPTMTGWDFLDVFEEICPAIQSLITVYILTSSIEDFTKEKKKYPGVKGFISKPLMREKLEMIIQEVSCENISEKVDF